MGKAVVSGLGVSLFGSNDGSMPSVQLSAGGSGIQLLIDPDKLPTSVGVLSQKGIVWRDGNTLKVKTN